MTKNQEDPSQKIKEKFETRIALLKKYKEQYQKLLGSKNPEIRSEATIYFLMFNEFEQLWEVIDVVIEAHVGLKDQYGNLLKSLSQSKTDESLKLEVEQLKEKIEQHDSIFSQLNDLIEKQIEEERKRAERGKGLYV